MAYTTWGPCVLTFSQMQVWMEFDKEHYRSAEGNACPRSWLRKQYCGSASHILKFYILCGHCLGSTIQVCLGVLSQVRKMPGIIFLSIIPGLLLSCIIERCLFWVWILYVESFAMT